MSKYSLEVSNEGGTLNLKFGGDLVINYADKLAEQIREAMPQPAPLAVTVDNPSNIDMTFVQMLVALRHSCQKAGLAYSVKSTLKDDLKELLTKAGLTAELGL